jgi:hypothetical protein
MRASACRTTAAREKKPRDPVSPLKHPSPAATAGVWVVPADLSLPHRVGSRKSRDRETAPCPSRESTRVGRTRAGWSTDGGEKPSARHRCPVRKHRIRPPRACQICTRGPGHRERNPPASPQASELVLMATAGHRSFTTTKQYLQLAGRVFPDAAQALQDRLVGDGNFVPILYPSEPISDDLSESEPRNHAVPEGA